MPRLSFTLRDVFWLTLVVAMGVGWWLSHQRAMSSENAYKAWGFEIAAKILKKRTGEEMTVNRGGVWIRHPNGSSEQHMFGP